MAWSRSDGSMGSTRDPANLHAEYPSSEAGSDLAFFINPARDERRNTLSEPWGLRRISSRTPFASPLVTSPLRLFSRRPRARSLRFIRPIRSAAQRMDIGMDLLPPLFLFYLFRRYLWRISMDDRAIPVGLGNRDRNRDLIRRLIPCKPNRTSVVP